MSFMSILKMMSIYSQCKNVVCLVCQRKCAYKILLSFLNIKLFMLMTIPLTSITNITHEKYFRRQSATETKFTDNFQKLIKIGKYLQETYLCWGPLFIDTGNCHNVKYITITLCIRNYVPPIANNITIIVFNRSIHKNSLFNDRLNVGHL